MCPPHQQMSGRNGQDRCDGARASVLGKNLSEGATIERQQAILGGGNDEFRFLCVRQYRGSNRDQRGGGQISSHGVVFEQSPAGVILRESSWACYVQTAVEAGCLKEHRRRADSFKDLLL